MLHRAGAHIVRTGSWRWLIALMLASQPAWGQDPDAPGAAAGVERDDPGGRSAFELLRLRDPSSHMVPSGIRRRELDFARTLPDVADPLRREKGTDRPDAAASSWNPRGPYNVGGRTRALALDAADQNVILAGGVSGGMWRSANGGSTWAKVTGLDDLQSVTCLSQDRRPGHTNVWYYGTGEFSGNSASTSGDHADDLRGDGIFKSTDGGLSWAQLPSTVSGTPQAFDKVYDYVWNIATDPSNGAEEEVYAATYGGIRRSTDGGATWANVLGTGLTATSASTFTDIAVTSAGVLYATLSQSNLSGTSAPNRGIYRSTNGTTWTNITPPTFPTAYRRIVLAVAPSNENTVYFLLESPLTGGLRHKLYRYAYLNGDGSGTGGAWSDRTANLPAFGGVVGDFDSQSSYDMVVKVRPDNEDIVFLGGVNLYRSTDGFTTSANTSWIGGYSIINNFAPYPNHHHDQHAIVFLPSNPAVMFTGNDGGVQKTTNCLAPTVVWTWLNNGYTTSQFYSVAVDHATPGDNILAGGMQDNGTWWTGSASPTTGWVNTRAGDGGFCAVAGGKSSYYFSSQYGVTYRYLLSGSGAVTGFTRVDPTGGAGYAFITPFVLNPNNDAMMFLAAGGTVWRNSNLMAIPLSSNNTTSVNWTKLTNTGTGGGTVSALAVSTFPAGRLYYGRSSGRVYRIDAATTGDPVPADITGSGFPAGAYVSCIAADPSDANRLIVVFSNYSVQSLFASSDGGSTWEAVAGNLEQYSNGSGDGPSCRWAAIVPGGGYFVGTSTGLYSTTILRGANTSWSSEGSGMIGSTVVDMIDMRTSDGLIALGTHGGGAFTSNVSLSVPPAPILIGPAGVDQPLEVTCQWHPSPLATAYRLDVSDDSTFSSVIVRDSALADTSAAVGGLVNKTRYFWRVAGHNAIGWGAYATTGVFTTIVDTPQIPSPVAPPDGAIRLPVNAVLVWNHPADGESYELEVATDPAFTAVAGAFEIFADTFKVVPDLLNGTQYFWRVRAKNPGGTSGYSPARAFTTVLASPALAAPASGAGYQQIHPALVWRALAGASTYHLQVSPTALFTSTVHDDSLLTDTSDVPGPLSPAALYYWRVAGRDTIGDGPWSAARSFTTIAGAPATPQTVFPPDGSVEISVVATLRWSASAGTRFYHVQVDTSGTFAAPGIDDSTVVDTARSAAVLAKDRHYYWRVRAINDLGSSGWSPTADFRTINEIQASVPMASGWNMRSVPLVLPDYRRTTVYPGSTAAYAYAGAYQVAETLSAGLGYWIREQVADSVLFLGMPVELESLDVTSGWNLVGSVGEAVGVGSVGELPPDIVASNFFGYDLGYVVADTIRPFQAYWVKASAPGKLIFGSMPPPAQPRQVRSWSKEYPDLLEFSTLSGERQSLVFGTGPDGTLAFPDLPPPAPDDAFDVRFGTNDPQATFQREIQLQLRSAHYPVTVRWELGGDAATLVAGRRTFDLRGSGSAALEEPAGLLLRLEAEHEVPLKARLEQNFPNPFNPSTVIRYGVPHAGFVRLVVYDLLGREVRRLVEGWREGGFYAAELDAAGLSGGVYTYRLSAGGISISRKLVLLK